jgi:hypothetical protein
VSTVHPDRETLRAAIALANRAPSVHNSQPWRWRIGDASIHLYVAPERALPATDPEGRDLRISCGAALHHLRVALRAAGMDSRVRRLTNPATPEHLATLELTPRRPTDDDLALASAIERRHTDRRVFSTWPVTLELLDDLVRAAEAEDGVLQVLVGPAERFAMARLVEHAAVEQAVSPGVTQETAAWTGRSRSAADGVPAVVIPAQPAGAVPVRNFAAGELRQPELGRYESDGTVLTILATRSDGPLEQLRAGEALSAVLLTATRIGLATDPISQPLEVPATRAELREACLRGAAEPQIALRVGWAPIAAEPLPATGRRPVDETIEEPAQPRL